MPKSYQPSIVEDGWYSWWAKEGYFKPEYNAVSLSVFTLASRPALDLIPPSLSYLSLEL